MKKLLFVITVFFANTVFAQDQKQLRYIRFLEIGITDNAHHPNTLTLSIDSISRKTPLERSGMGTEIFRPFGFDIDSIYERYKISDRRTYKKILHFLKYNKQLECDKANLPNRLEFPTFQIIVDGNKKYYIKHEQVDAFFDKLIEYLKSNNCDLKIIHELAMSKFG